MRELTASEAREQWSELLNRAAYGKEPTVIVRRGKRLAAIVPAEVLDKLEALEDEALAAEGRQRLEKIRAGREEVVPFEPAKPRRAAKKR